MDFGDHWQRRGKSECMGVLSPVASDLVYLAAFQVWEDEEMAGPSTIALKLLSDVKKPFDPADEGGFHDRPDKERLYRIQRATEYSAMQLYEIRLLLEKLVAK